MPPEMMMKAMPRETIPTEALLRKTLIQLTQNDVHHAPNELKSVPRASVWRMIMTNRASVVLNSGLLFHCVLNHLRNFIGGEGCLNGPLNGLNIIIVLLSYETDAQERVPPVILN